MYECMYGMCTTYCIKKVILTYANVLHPMLRHVGTPCILFMHIFIYGVTTFFFLNNACFTYTWRKLYQKSIWAQKVLRAILPIRRGLHYKYYIYIYIHV